MQLTILIASCFFTVNLVEFVIHHYVRAGMLPIGWAGDAGMELECGEWEMD